MFSREESKRIREEFWTEFGQKFPRKWILYNTRIKEVQLKFTFTNDHALVSLDVSSSDELIQQYYTEKFQSLETILRTDYLPEATLEENYILPEGKSVTRIYVQLEGVNIHNRKHWEQVFQFLYKNMEQLENFFTDFRDFIRD